MGQGAELEMERMIDSEVLYFRAELRAEKGLWETRDGQILKVTDMTTRHIQNCLRMLERGNSPYADPFIGMFEKELERRDDG